MGFLDFIFGVKKRQIKELLAKDAIILDVRTQKEWENGHIENAKHIPLDELETRVDELKKLNKPVVTCCASGVRSAKAAEFLNLNNIIATNGGGWLRLKSQL
ncbi:rhodanese-like domain-containing protein [Subsaxibacter sp. CAU 1640]|uniref:rhodanese-like domain-containing protein n=1 Tax=Subsaxibacter sp. CAU 1640 TaxID=2933271 RepID=UPI002003FCFC|nr:rhodanese-like domain-containing protein [Subsaxibacter sp. CAU 1640]MCK7590300.1 rhodanese-like domain-containing protein [Subsaxibacter sp. CAU 1640]